MYLFFEKKCLLQEVLIRCNFAAETLHLAPDSSVSLEAREVVTELNGLFCVKSEQALLYLLPLLLF